MSIRPLIACSVVIAALALAQGAPAQNRPAAPAAAPNAPAPVIAKQADRLLKEVGGVTNAFTVQSFGTPTNTKDTVQLAPGTQTYLEVLWGSSWLVGSAGGATFFVRTLVPPLGPAYVKMLTDQGPTQAL